MKTQAILPLVDLGFLSLGAIVAVLTQTQLIDALPLELARDGEGIAPRVSESLPIVRIDETGVELDSEPIALGQLADVVKGDRVIVRTAGESTTQQLVDVLGALASAGIAAELEVRTGPPADAFAPSQGAPR